MVKFPLKVRFLVTLAVPVLLVMSAVMLAVFFFSKVKEATEDEIIAVMNQMPRLKNVISKFYLNPSASFEDFLEVTRVFREETTSWGNVKDESIVLMSRRVTSILDQIEASVDEQDMIGALIGISSLDKEISDFVSRRLSQFASISFLLRKGFLLQVFFLIISIAIILVLTAIGVNMIVRPIEQLTGEVNKVAQGNLKVRRVEVRVANLRIYDEVKGLSDNIAKMVDSLRTILMSISETSRKLLKSSKGLFGMSEKMDKRFEEQVERLTDVTQAVAEISESFKEIRRNAEKIEQASSNAFTEVKMGQDSIRMGTSELQSIIRSSDRLKGVLGGLTEIYGNVSGFMEFVADIADRVNLLALNAAIEAARVGEAGKGFRVVADEIRKLSSIIQQAARDATKNLERVDEVLKMARDVIQGTVGGLEKVGEFSNAVSNILLRIHEAVVAVDNDIKGIVAAIRQQTAFIMDISRFMEEVATAASKTSDEAKLIEDSSLALEKLSETLEEKVSKFKF